MTSNASNVTPSNAFQDAIRSGVRDLSAVWWWFLSLGVLWTLFGAYVLSYRVGQPGRRWPPWPAWPSCSAGSVSVRTGRWVR
jgi:hypothetical protein